MLLAAEKQLRRRRAARRREQSGEGRTVEDAPASGRAAPPAPGSASRFQTCGFTHRGAFPLPGAGVVEVGLGRVIEEAAAGK